MKLDKYRLAKNLAYINSSFEKLDSNFSSSLFIFGKCLYSGFGAVAIDTDNQA